MLLRKIPRRAVPPLPRCPQFKDCELVESTVTTVTPDGAISEKRMLVPVYKLVDDASSVRVNEVVDDYSIDNMQRLGLPMLPVTTPYFKPSLDNISSFVSENEAKGIDAFVQEEVVEEPNNNPQD